MKKQIYDWCYDETFDPMYCYVAIALHAKIKRPHRVARSLIDAILCSDTLAVDVILEQDPSSLERPDSAGITPLMVATLGKRDLCVASLLQRGANPNAKNKFNHTARDCAAHLGRLQRLPTVTTTKKEKERESSPSCLADAELRA